VTPDYIAERERFRREIERETVIVVYRLCVCVCGQAGSSTNKTTRKIQEITEMIIGN